MGTCTRCGKERKVKNESIPQPGGGSYEAVMCTSCATELRQAQKG